MIVNNVVFITCVAEPKSFLKLSDNDFLLTDVQLSEIVCYFSIFSQSGCVSLQVNKMSLDESVDDRLQFRIFDSSSDPRLEMHIHADSADQKSLWISQIRNMLDMQGNFLRGEP